MIKNRERNEKIFKLANQDYSFGLIAKTLGISRSVVAGVIWRWDNHKKKKNGRGYHGAGPYARKTLLTHG